jgi:hypothetical protein
MEEHSRCNSLSAKFSPFMSVKTFVLLNDYFAMAAIGYSDSEIPCNVCMVLQYSAPIIVVFQIFKG